jgi:hypothetical protein
MTSTLVVGSGEIQNPGSLTRIMTGNISFHYAMGIQAPIRRNSKPRLCFLRVDSSDERAHPELAVQFPFLEGIDRGAGTAE